MLSIGEPIFVEPNQANYISLRHVFWKSLDDILIMLPWLAMLKHVVFVHIIHLIIHTSKNVTFVLLGLFFHLWLTRCWSYLLSLCILLKPSARTSHIVSLGWSNRLSKRQPILISFRTPLIDLCYQHKIMLIIRWWRNMNTEQYDPPGSSWRLNNTFCFVSLFCIICRIALSDWQLAFH